MYAGAARATRAAKSSEHGKGMVRICLRVNPG